MIHGLTDPMMVVPLDSCPGPRRRACDDTSNGSRRRSRGRYGNSRRRSRLGRICVPCSESLALSTSRLRVTHQVARPIDRSGFWP